MYAKPNDVGDYAAAIVKLMDDEPRRSLLGKLGRARVEQELAWSHQVRAYLDVYRRLLGGRRGMTGIPTAHADRPVDPRTR